MPWRPPAQAGPGAGFTTAEPWLPVVADAGFLCVESQQHDPGSTLAFVRRLIHLRSREPTLQSGAQRRTTVGACPGGRTAPPGQDVCWSCLSEPIRACVLAARTASASVSMS